MDRRVGVALAIVALLALAGCVNVDVTIGGPADEGDPATHAQGTLAPGDGIRVTVVQVVDGDTLDVRYPNGTTDTVRLLGVDSPEVHVENDPAEYESVPDTEAGASCLRDAGQAASDFARRHLADETVTLVVDPTADRRGSYGRLLAYVRVDGSDFNYRLVATGHARVYDTTFARADRYYATERQAQEDGDGLWTCRTP